MSVEQTRARPPARIDLPETVLRQWSETDAQAVHLAKTESFAHLHPWAPWAAAPSTVAEDLGFVRFAAREWSESRQYLYGMFDPDERLVLGAVGLHDRQGPGVMEIGYWVRSGWTRRGLATAGAAALTEAAFALPGVRRVEIRCDEANTASAGVPRRLGYRLDRVDERVPEAPAETGRMMVWALTRQC